MVMFFVAKICVRNPCLHLHDRDRRVYLPWDNSVLQEDTMAFFVVKSEKAIPAFTDNNWRCIGIMGCSGCLVVCVSRKNA